MTCPLSLLTCPKCRQRALPDAMGCLWCANCGEAFEPSSDLDRERISALARRPITPDRRPRQRTLFGGVE